ncbi:MAG TPA: ATP-binding cassette domain-containing protein, partial [Modestobacter sp.]|nr:ATP-binding cassette domain-containing protein [Modestobacter sp.]
MARPWRRTAARPAEETVVRPRTALELVDVSHSYGERTVLRDLSVVLAEHRVGVIGSNGSGKSTFARLLNGLVVPT